MLKARLNQELFGKLTADLQKEYKKEGEVYTLDVEAVDGFALENADGLRSTIQATRTERDNLKNAMKAFDGLDPATVRTRISDAEKLLADPNSKNMSEAQKNSLIKQLEDNHKAALQPFVEENAFYKAQVEKHLKENTAIQAITAAKGNSKLLLPHVLPHIKVEKVDGNLVARVVDSNGQIRISKKSGSAGENMSIGEFVEGMRAEQDYASCFEANNQSGGGSRSSAGNSGAGSSGQYVMTPEIARDPSRYLALKEAAAKAGVPITFPVQAPMQPVS